MRTLLCDIDTDGNSGDANESTIVPGVVFVVARPCMYIELLIMKQIVVKSRVDAGNIL